MEWDDCLTRPGASSGQWMIWMVPFAVILSSLKSSEPNNTLIALSLGLMCSPFFKLILAFAGYDSHSSKIYVTVLSGALTCWTLILCEAGIPLILLGVTLVSYVYTYGVSSLLRHCPKSFTFGEASVIIQSAVIFLYSSLTNISKHWHLVPQDDMDKATIILQVGLTGVGLICLGLWLFMFLRYTAHFYMWCFGVLGFCVILPLHIIMDTSPVLWILELLFADVTTMQMVFYWCACCLVAVAAIIIQVQRGKQASTVTRKSFHILVVAVYLPGLIGTYCLLYLASGIVLALFIMLETVRLLCIPPFYTGLQQGFEMFADEKDVGIGALTPLYLLAGVSLPLWLHPKPVSWQQLPSALLSGLLSVGIGDTAASAVGSSVGQYYWPGSKKTIEGTVACIGSQIIGAIALMKFGYIDGSVISIAKMTMAVIVTSLVEANTDQVDNLILPLIMYCILII